MNLCACRRLLILVSIACLGAPNATLWAVSVRTVPLSGQQAPGTPAGVNFVAFSFTLAPSLDDKGQAAFDSELTGTGVVESNRYGLWHETSAGLALLARTGSPAPGTPPGV